MNLMRRVMDFKVRCCWKLLALTVVYVACYTGMENAPYAAIGGYRVTPNELTWKSTVYLHFTHPDAWFKVCGGILVSRRWVLTAAHCVQQIQKRTWHLSVGIGSMRRFAFQGYHNYSVSKIMIHPCHYSQENGKFCLDNDIALVKLYRKSPAKIPLIPLANRHDDIASKKDVGCKLAGWGSVHRLQKGNRDGVKGYKVSLDLMKINVNLITKKECIRRDNAKDDPHLNCGKDRTMPRLICGDMSKLGTPSGCIGDSGAPLICRVNGRRTVQGILVGGSSLCRTQGKSMRFVEVSKYVTWIKHTLRRE